MYVLNGAPPAVGILALDALCDMICDWSVAILEETINDPGKSYRVRQYAITKLGELLIEATERGYWGITPEGCRLLVGEAKTKLETQKGSAHFCEIQAVEDLCDHLSQAVTENIFGQLPDF